MILVWMTTQYRISKMTLCKYYLQRHFVKVRKIQ